MTRPAVKMGLPGSGQDVFPDQARELGRRLGLYDAEVLILRYSEIKSAGATKAMYTPDAEPVRGRLDPVGHSAGGVSGGVQNESSTHLVTFEDGQDISTSDRVLVEENTWIITAKHEQTDELIMRVEVRRATSGNRAVS